MGLPFRDSLCLIFRWTVAACSFRVSCRKYCRLYNAVHITAALAFHTVACDDMPYYKITNTVYVVANTMSCVGTRPALLLIDVKNSKPIQNK